MKKLYYLLIVLMGVCIGACSNDDGVDNSQPTPEVPEPDKITLSQQTIEVGFEPDTYAVNVTSPYSWDAVSKNDWIVVDSPTGIAGTKQLSFSIARNEEEKVREGTIVVKNSDFNLITELYITQGAFVPSELSVTPKTLNFSAVGGEESIAVTANFTHTATTDADWLTITKTEKGYTIAAPEYLEVDLRTAEVVILNEKYGISEVVNVTQSAFVPEISITPKTLNFSIAGGEKNITVTANFEHSATTDVDWLTITKTEDGYTIKASANPELEDRTAEVVISNEKYKVSETIQIAQEGPNEKQLIYYTSKNSSVVTPNNSSVFGANIISNTYNNGVGVIVFDGEVTTIGEWAFGYCDSLTSVTIPNSVTTIGEGAFYNCSSLTSITIPDSVTTIGYAAFGYCDSLTSVTIPNSVTTIGEGAFYNCSSLTSITIPDSVTTIGDWAFGYCSSLTSITIPDSVTTIGDYAFYSCDNLTSVTISDSVTTIGEYAFADCSSLPIIDNIRYADTYLIETTDKTMSVYTIKDNTRFIGNDAFQFCSSLTSVTIPESVTSIGDYAFYGCDSLTSVTIPDSVTTIGNSAFTYCSSLTSVYCKATTPPVGGSDMFNHNASGRKIYVPMESVNAYKSASYWSSYASYIVGYNF